MKTEKRRRREGKTDYKARLGMLKSGKARIVFRKTNRYIIGQYVKSKEAQDSVDIGISSRELLKFRWPREQEGSLKSLPAAYLTGFLLGKKVIDKNGKTNAILDIGLIRNIPKSRTYAFVKGISDAGVEIPCSKESFPEENRIRGKNMKKSVDFDRVKQEIDKNA
jgi:large subunit ribosomal protein L18